MPFVILFSGIFLLILLITWLKLDAFVSFLIVSLCIGLANGMPITDAVVSVQKGMGALLGDLVVILILGAMLGKLIADYGAAQRIVDALMKVFGRKYLMWALVVTAFIVGIPLFYNVGFVLLVPLIVTISYQYDIPAVSFGLPMLSVLSVMHGFLPPHPSPVALIKAYHADFGMTLIYGFAAAIPAVILAGPVFALTLKKYKQKPLKTFAGKSLPENEMPGLPASFITALMPVVLIALATVLQRSSLAQSMVAKFFIMIGEPVIALLLTLIYALLALVIFKKKKLAPAMFSLSDAARDTALILLVIAGAGGLKQVLTDSGTSDLLTAAMRNFHLHPILAAWCIAAFIRVCLGSATVAGLTAAGIVAPMLVGSAVNPCLVVLATGAGSLMFSHVNDGGFWMFKEYFGLTVKETLKTWSVMETIVSVVGLLMVLLMNTFIS